MWILYIAGIQLGARLVVPYIPIYLNDYLHIPRELPQQLIHFRPQQCLLDISLLHS